MVRNTLIKCVIVSFFLNACHNAGVIKNSTVSQMNLKINSTKTTTYDNESDIVSLDIDPELIKQNIYAEGKYNPEFKVGQINDMIEIGDFLVIMPDRVLYIDNKNNMYYSNHVIQLSTDEFTDYKKIKAWFEKVKTSGSWFMMSEKNIVRIVLGNIDLTSLKTVNNYQVKVLYTNAIKICTINELIDGGNNCVVKPNIINPKLVDDNSSLIYWNLVGINQANLFAYNLKTQEERKLYTLTPRLSVAPSGIYPDVEFIESETRKINLKLSYVSQIINEEGESKAELVNEVYGCNLASQQITCPNLNNSLSNNSSDHQNKENFYRMIIAKPSDFIDNGAIPTSIINVLTHYANQLSFPVRSISKELIPSGKYDGIDWKKLSISIAPFLVTAVLCTVEFLNYRGAKNEYKMKNMQLEKLRKDITTQQTKVKEVDISFNQLIAKQQRLYNIQTRIADTQKIMIENVMAHEKLIQEIKGQQRRLTEQITGSKDVSGIIKAMTENLNHTTDDIKEKNKTLCNTYSNSNREFYSSNNKIRLNNEFDELVKILMDDNFKLEDPLKINETLNDFLSNTAKRTKIEKREFAIIGGLFSSDEVIVKTTEIYKNINLDGGSKNGISPKVVKPNIFEDAKKLVDKYLATSNDDIKDKFQAAKKTENFIFDTQVLLARLFSGRYRYQILSDLLSELRGASNITQKITELKNAEELLKSELDNYIATIESDDKNQQKINQAVIDLENSIKPLDQQYIDEQTDLRENKDMFNQLIETNLEEIKSFDLKFMGDSLNKNKNVLLIKSITVPLSVAAGTIVYYFLPSCLLNDCTLAKEIIDETGNVQEAPTAVYKNGTLYRAILNDTYFLYFYQVTNFTCSDLNASLVSAIAKDGQKHNAAVVDMNGNICTSNTTSLYQNIEHY